MHIRYPLAEARDRAGEWGPDSDLEPYDAFDVSVAQRERLEALFPGFTYEQIMAGLTVPACEEEK